MRCVPQCVEIFCAVSERERMTSIRVEECLQDQPFKEASVQVSYLYRKADPSL